MSLSVPAGMLHAQLTHARLIQHFQALMPAVPWDSCLSRQDIHFMQYLEIAIRRKDISSDESLQQGRNRSRELNFSP